VVSFFSFLGAENISERTSFQRAIDFCSSENFEDYIRVVAYNLKKTTTVIGTAYFTIGGSPSGEKVTVDLTTGQEGFLVLRLASFPELELESLTDKEIVQMYVSGNIFSRTDAILSLEDNDTPPSEPPMTPPGNFSTAPSATGIPGPMVSPIFGSDTSDSSKVTSTAVASLLFLSTILAYGVSCGKK